MNKAQIRDRANRKLKHAGFRMEWLFDESGHLRVGKIANFAFSKSKTA
jgi:hypothetical protein